MIVIASADGYVDIDGLGCATAYQELLGLQGIESSIVFPGNLNHSVSPLAQKYDYEISKELPSKVDGFVVVDVSEPSHIASFIQPSEVIDIFDHHYGFIDFWEKEIGKEKVHIEMVGACATLIWEQFKKKGFEEKITENSASLLAMGILSNTLNFVGSLTDKRDIQAFKELESKHSLPEGWIEQYFQEQEKIFVENPVDTITNDTKIQEVPNLDKPIVIGQIELWDGKEFLEKHLGAVQESLNSHNNPYWMMNVSSIRENKNYIYSENAEVKGLLKSALGFQFNENMCRTDRLYQRKEILKALYSHKTGSNVVH